MREPRKYSPELKEEAIKMVFVQGLTQPAVAQRLSIPKGTIGNWIAKAKAKPESIKLDEQTLRELAAENKRLKKELAETRLEREILPLIVSSEI